MCRSTNRSRVAAPEVWFRILHVAADGRNGVSVASHREQTVEIALGPNGTFGDGKAGTLTRQVAARRVVSAVPPRRGSPKPPKEPKTPRVVELLRKAIEWQGLLASGKASNQASIARSEGITRARVTQIMDLLRLSPEIQHLILSMPATVRRSAITERALRPVVQIEDPQTQLASLQNLAAHTD